jgi:hypothetical protein
MNLPHVENYIGPLMYTCRSTVFSNWIKTKLVPLLLTLQKCITRMFFSRARNGGWWEYFPNTHLFCILRSIRFLHKHKLSNTVVSLTWQTFFQMYKLLRIDPILIQFITDNVFVLNISYFYTSPFWHYTRVSLVPHNSCVYLTVSVQATVLLSGIRCWRKALKSRIWPNLKYWWWMFGFNWK